MTAGGCRTQLQPPLIYCLHNARDPNEVVLVSHADVSLYC